MFSSCFEFLLTTLCYLVTNMDKVEYRSVIKFFFLQKKGPSVIHQEMLAVYKEACPCYSVIKHWCRQFSCGRLSIYDEPRGGRPSTSTDDNNIRRIEKLIMENRRISIGKIAAEVGVSRGTVHNIIHEELHMSKVSARCVPRLLTPFQKKTRVDLCQELLGMCNA